jgi:hypothetical protein
MHLICFATSNKLKCWPNTFIDIDKKYASVYNNTMKKEIIQRWLGQLKLPYLRTLSIYHAKEPFVKHNIPFLFLVKTISDLELSSSQFNIYILTYKDIRQSLRRKVHENPNYDGRKLYEYSWIWI